MQATTSRPSLLVTADGTGVVSHAGTRLLANVADAVGLSAAFGDAFGRGRRRRSAHDPGRVLTDVAVMLADGGEAISEPPGRLLEAEAAAAREPWATARQSDAVGGPCTSRTTPTATAAEDDGATGMAHHNPHCDRVQSVLPGTHSSATYPQGNRPTARARVTGPISAEKQLSHRELRREKTVEKIIVWLTID